jgi:AcrR family transcriptional regulator
VKEQADMADTTSLRDRILAGTAAVIKERGMAAATTKQIAQAAGVSEGSIYNHFANKSELIAATMGEVTGGIRSAMTRLFGRVGKGTLEENLTEYAVACVAFFQELLPIVGHVLGSRDMLRSAREDGTGVHNAVQGAAALTRYLEEERRAGRIGPDANPPQIAFALLGACQQYAFLTLVATPESVAATTGVPADPAEYARGAVCTVLGAQT